MEPKNRFKLPVQAGEFVDVQNGEAHVLSCVEEWEDAPEESSGYREINIHGMYLKLSELQQAVRDHRGFAEIESDYKQSFAAEPLEQDAFNCGIDFNENTVAKIVTTTGFLQEDLPDGYYFVKFAYPVLYSHLQGQIMEAWGNFKVITTNSKPSAGVASNWIDDYLKDHPELDAPWIRDEIFGMISMEEEPAEWDGSKHPFVGRTVVIRRMKGEPQYSGRTGTVMSVDDAGQLHGTWGGCALIPEEDQFEFVSDGKTGVDEKHFNDGYVDFRVIDEFCMAVFANRDGDSKTVGFDDNFFSPIDLVKAYKDVFKEDWGEDKESFAAVFKAYLIACGCKAEEVEEDE